MGITVHHYWELSFVQRLDKRTLTYELSIDVNQTSFGCVMFMFVFFAQTSKLL